MGHGKRQPGEGTTDTLHGVGVLTTVSTGSGLLRWLRVVDVEASAAMIGFVGLLGP